MAVATELQNIFGEQKVFRRLMRFMATGAILNHIVFEFRFFQEIIVTIPAKRRAGFLYQTFLVSGVRIVARQAITITNRLVDIFGVLSGNVVMAVGTGFFYGLLEQPFDLAGVRCMALQTVTVAHGLVDKFFPGRQVIVTIRTGVLNGFLQQTFKVRCVG